MTAVHCRQRRFALVALMSSIVAAGCVDPHKPTDATPISTSPALYRLPDNVQYSEHWASTPALDLMSPDGTFVRAFVEADRLQIHNSDEVKGSYPGYARADRPVNDNMGGTGRPQVGYANNWVLDFTVNPDNTATADVCVTESINSAGTDAEGGAVKTLHYRRDGQSPPANQRGPNRAPQVSVFGDWKAVSYDLTRRYLTPDGHWDIRPCFWENKMSNDKSVVPVPGWPNVEGAA